MSSRLRVNAAWSWWGCRLLVSNACKTSPEIMQLFGTECRLLSASVMRSAAAEDAAEAKREADIVAKAKTEISNIKLNAACDELKSKMVACTKDEVDAEAHLKDLRVIAEEPADEQADSCKEELANFKCE